ncbi:MAG: M48 family metalloprotease [Acidimicrobiales bacterium]
MIAALFVAGLSLLALPSLLRRCGRRVRPSWWARLCAVALLAGLVLVLGTAAFGSLPGLLWLVGLPKVARACEEMFGYSLSTGPYVSFVTMGLSVSMLVLGGRSLRRYRDVASRSWLEAVVGQRLESSDPFEIVVLDSPLARALSVPGRAGRPGQIHLTTGLIAALSSDELDLVRAHEEAHLGLAHHRYLVLAVMVEGSTWFWPPARSSTKALRLSLERWADETAAGDDTRSRSRLASALFAVAAEAERPALAAFSALDGLIERATAMREPTHVKMPALWWPVLLVPGVLLGVASLYGTTRLGSSAFCLVSMPSRCQLL